MSLTVNFKTQSGENHSRRFQVNEGVSVYGKVTGLFLPDSFAYVRMDITDKNGTAFYFDEGNADALGNYDFWFRTPMTDTKLTVNISVKHPGGNVERVSIPIGVGNIAPDALPAPSSQFNWLDVVPLLLVAGVGIYLFKIIKE